MWMHVTFLKKKMLLSYAEPDQFHAVQSALKDAGVEEFTVAELTMLAQNDVTLPEDAQAQFEKWLMH